MKYQESKCKMQILKIITLLGIGGIISKFVYIFCREKKNNTEQQFCHEKLQILYCILNHWLEIRQHEKTLVPYFQEKGIHKIAIYGMKELGQRLYDELLNSSIEVKYAIDQNADKLYAGVPIFKPDQDLENVDAIVVTAPFYFEQIKKTLSEKSDAMILNIEDIIFSVH